MGSRGSGLLARLSVYLLDNYAVYCAFMFSNFCSIVLNFRIKSKQPEKLKKHASVK